MKFPSLTTLAVSVAALPALATAALAQTEITWWHAKTAANNAVGDTESEEFY